MSSKDIVQINFILAATTSIVNKIYELFSKLSVTIR